MSSIPLAKRSKVHDLTVTPDKWESYPVIDRSKVLSCSFEHLTSATRIRRSKLIKVRLQASSSSGGSSSIKNSKVSDSVVTGSNIKSSKLSHCVFRAVGYAKGSKADGAHLEHVRRLKRSDVGDSTIRNTRHVKWSSVQRSSVTDTARIKRSSVRNTHLANSVVDRSSLTDCIVSNCEIYRTSFTGMVLENGIWRNGQLVGRTREREVVARRKTDADKVGLSMSCNLRVKLTNPGIRSNRQQRTASVSAC